MLSYIALEFKSNNWTAKPNFYEVGVLRRNPHLVYLKPDKFIEGMQVYGRDIQIFTYDGTDYELTQFQVDKMILKVKAKLTEYKFCFVSQDGESLIKMPDWFIDSGRQIAYALAFNEIITGKESNWNLLLQAF